MITRCAWCEREGKYKGEPEPTEPVSHGICQPHQDEVLEEILQMKELKRVVNPHRRRRKKR